MHRCAAALVLLLALAAVARAQTNCDLNPDSCSPEDNHFHRNVKFGYCLRGGKVSENWSRRFSTSPQSDHAGILFGGNQLVVNGGLGSGGNILDTLALNIDEYTVKQLPKLPGNAFRRGHSAIRWGNQMVVYGGVDAAGTVRSEIFSLQLASSPDSNLLSPAGAWTTVAATGAKALSYHSANLWGTQMIVYGGKSTGDFSNGDLLSFDLTSATGAFTTLSTQVKGPAGQPRFMHASAIADNTLYVFGGKWELVLFSDLWAFDLKASAWRRLLASTAFTRYSHSMSFMPACQSLVIFGGFDENKNLQKSVLAYHIDYDTMSIVKASEGSAQFARGSHVGIASGSRLYIHGGLFANGSRSGDLFEWM